MRSITGDRLPALAWASSRPFTDDCFHAVTNTEWNKPAGGFWTSPAEAAGSTWTRWLIEQYGSYDGIVREVKVDCDAMFLLIDTMADFTAILTEYKYEPPLLAALRNAGFVTTSLDFERMSKDWAGVYLTEAGQWRTRYDESGSLLTGASLYGWDIESVLFLNNEPFTVVQ